MECDGMKFRALRNGRIHIVLYIMNVFHFSFYSE